MKWKQFFTPVTSITSEEADTMVAENAGAVVFVDVRQQREYEGGHLPGAKLLPLGDLDNQLGELNRDKHIIIY